MRAVPTFIAALLLTSPCWAEHATVQTDDLPSAGRVVITLAGVGPITVRQHGVVVDIAVPASNDVLAPGLVPRNVVSMVGAQGSAHMTVVAGAVAKAKQQGRTVVIFILDPVVRVRDAVTIASLHPNPGAPPAAPVVQEAAKPPVTETPQAPVVASAPPPPSTPEHPAEPSAAPPAKPQPSDAEPSPAPVEPTAAAAPPVAPSDKSPPSTDAPTTNEAAKAAPDGSAPTTVSPPSRPATRAFTVTAGPEVGAAAFRLGATGIVVFDDEVSLSDSDDAENTLTPTATSVQHGTIMSVPVADDEALTATRSDQAITIRIGAATGSPAATSAIPTGVQFQIAMPGRAMAVSDPVTGQTMLIGTTRQMNGQHANVDIGRSAPGYVLLSTWLGMALETSSDVIDIKASLLGYTLSVADKAATNATAPARLENQFNIPIAPVPVLLRQMNAQIASAAAAPIRARGPDRVAAARSMLALGMSSESEALLSLAATDDPRIARDPGTLALTGIAAVLAGRPAEAGGLDDPALPTGGDIALWRGLRDLAQDKPAPELAGAWPLLAAYPEAIRQQVAPIVMEAAAENGADIPAADMDGVSLALSRAMKLVHDGKTDEAIAALEAINNGRDERDSVRAAIALAELRFRAGRASAAETADQLERQTVRWRGDGQELTLRMRIAVLRSQANQWRAALESLRDTRAAFPDSKAKVAAAQAEVFRSLLAADSAKVAPLDLVLLAGEFADNLPDGSDGDRLAGLLADKLAALDLPTRAIAVLQTLYGKAQSSTARAEYGLSLAQMQLDAGDASAASATVSDLSGLPAGREEQRVMLVSRIKAAQGDFAGAATVLLTLSSPEADDMRAKFYAKAGDWQRSLDTLDGMVSARVPDTGDLNETQQDLVLREATAAVQAGNTDALRKLTRFDRRMMTPRAELFRVMTATAVKGPEDLPRSARELAMSKSLPERLSALKVR